MVYLKSSKRMKEKLQQEKPELYADFKKVWDMRQRHDHCEKCSGFCAGHFLKPEEMLKSGATPMKERNSCHNCNRTR